jgi:hypothetical protein
MSAKCVQAPRTKRARAVGLALAGCLACIAFAGQAPTSDGARTAAPRDRRSAEWVAGAAARALDAEHRGDFDLAGAALAIRALSSPAAAIAPERVAALRDQLAQRQHTNGSFGAGDGSKPLTWLALGAFDGSPREPDVACAIRARAWLLAVVAPAPSATAGSSTTDGMRRALGFLQQARVPASDASGADAATLALYALAGGPFDLRAAYANAIAPAGDARATANETGAHALLDDPLHALALGVAVLDHYRTSTEAALLAESSRPALDIAREVAARFDGATGAWSPQPGAAASLVASACALSILDTLERWDAARIAQSNTAAAGATQRHATEMRGCEECHAGLQPGQHAQWKGSAHSRANVGCAACHGTNHSTIFRENGRVAATTCAQCHPKASKQFANSKHAHAEETLTQSALFEATPPAARESCMACHRIGAKQSDGSSGSCNFCHPAHTFDLRLANDPQACTQCHTGRDYPQDLAYRLSKHGAMHSVSPDANSAPTCATCHQPDGRHDDSFGITLGGSGSGAVLAGTATAFPMQTIANEEFAQRRGEMVAVCTRCHSSRLAEASLRQADELKREGEAHLLAAAEILRGLAADGYFGADASLALGPQFARPDPLSPGAALLERFYQMWRFDHAGGWKGAYHQSASVANHESGAGTREDLDFIRAEAERLRARGAKR